MVATPHNHMACQSQDPIGVVATQLKDGTEMEQGNT
jgi:hypothetical protein